MADGKSVREVDWSGCTLVSVRRGTDVIVPTGITDLKAGDVVTAFGTQESKDTLIDLLNSSGDEPTAEIVVDEVLAEGDQR
jgi:Trk K+ transport system NAD-binding subunit